ncbi:KpsF/GutQ family sugar-phosphate isomerase [Oceanibacterium hippocampi]|uniref:Arabinose 5-phosphate isomerase KdsD n=1 Tax=Oceanibacterium hippocampi TaxID=745714 RepID=A0A1Y5RRJ0_9PROT|nr:KpsF/GutQ family sugar-phosphate isomerase [Oceanibacterium hippocampi]SLN23241.1 Arabinose 5-phosphate isomerase KdsD [Oceanibacterium hippocampi]
MKVKEKSAPLSPDLEAAGRVLSIEAEALRALGDSLDDSFERAVDLLHAVTGRVVISGMGKSGHIGRKIAATMSSTGSPALFVHPGEASHGDLGMITQSDAVLCLSNSGNTNELADIIAFTRRFSIPLLAMVGRPTSSLGDAADVTLVLPTVPEACPMGLAPTTSTTMMLALGDALSVALLQRRGFSPDNFQVLHPGGSLGASLIKVSEIMHVGDELPVARPDTSMREALIVMTARSFGCVGVVDAAGDLLGIITDGDLRRHMDNDLLNRRAEEIMTRAPKTIRPGALAAEALGQMNATKISCLFVTEGRRPVGIIRVHDCLSAGVA